MALTQNYSLRLDADQRAKLEEIARRKDRDLSYVIRKAIDEYIERHEHDTNGAWPHQPWPPCPRWYASTAGQGTPGHQQPPGQAR